MEKKKGKGRPKHVPTDLNRQKVKNYSASGTTVVDIAQKLKIDKETLYKYYRDELEDGRIDANANVAGVLYKTAMGGNVTAAMFWMKTRAGWKETSGLELTGKDGGPVELSEAKTKLLAGLI